MREPFEGASTFLKLLFYAESITAVIIFVVTTIYYRNLSNYLGEKEQRILVGQLCHFHMFSVLIIFLYQVSIYMWQRLWDLPIMNDDIKMIINMWVWLNTFIFFCGFATVWSLSECAEDIIATAETSLTVGIDKYFECPKWKLRWDEVQFRQQCCGVNSYKDWINAVWVPKDCLKEESKTHAPYACCRQSNPDCYKKYVPGSGSSTMPLLQIMCINTNGCLPLFKKGLLNYISFLWFFLTVALIIQFFIFCMVRFILSNQTDNDNLAGSLSIGNFIDEIVEPPSSDACCVPSS